MQKQLFSAADEQHAALSLAHLEAAHVIFGKRRYVDVPASVHELLLLEAYILRCATNYLFHPAWRLPRDHVDSRLQLFQAGLVGLQRSPSACPWIGPIGIRTILTVYHLSWLAHRLPLGNEHASEVHGILERLSLDRQKLSKVIGNAAAVGCRALQDAYIAACMQLANSLLRLSVHHLGPDANDSSYKVSGITCVTTAMLACEERALSSLLWPAIVLGLGCTTEEECRAYRRILQQLIPHAGGEAVVRSQSMLEDVWVLTCGGDTSQVSGKKLLDIVASYKVVL
jgi:hypothetical protein